MMETNFVSNISLHRITVRIFVYRNMIIFFLFFTLKIKTEDFVSKFSFRSLFIWSFLIKRNQIVSRLLSFVHKINSWSKANSSVAGLVFWLIRNPDRTCSLTFTKIFESFRFRLVPTIPESHFWCTDLGWNDELHQNTFPDRRRLKIERQDIKKHHGLWTRFYTRFLKSSQY